MNEQIKELSKQYGVIESQLIEAKLAWASLDMENDELTIAVKKKNDQLKKFSSKVTQLEIELVNSK